MKGKKILGTVLTLALGCCVGAAACLIPANWDKITGGSQQEQPVEPGPPDITMVAPGIYSSDKPSKPTDIEMPYTIRTDFGFSFGLITSYTGKETDLVLPESYSYDSGFRIYKNASEFVNELKSFYPEDVDEPKSPFPLAVSDEYGFEQTVNSYEEIQSLKYFPVSTTIFQPKYLKGKNRPIFGIEKLTTNGNKTITSITMPKGYDRIIESAFKNFTALTTVNCPTTLEEIPDSCFKGCSNLKNFNFENITQIGDSAFYETAIEDISLPKLSLIQSKAFYSSKLKTVNLGESKITVLSSACFSSCSNLINITLPKTLTKIESQALYKCTKLDELTLPENVEEISSNFFGTKVGMKKLNINNSRFVIRITEQEPVVLSRYCEVIVPDNLYYAYMSDPNWNTLNIKKASQATNI